MEKKKIEFIELLRVLAVFSVFTSHILLGFWTINNVMQSMWHTPPVEYHSSCLTQISNILTHLKIHPGPFGVSIFFLISGFLTIFSLEKNESKISPSQFILKKAIRIYPIYWCSLIICMTVVNLFSVEQNLIYSIKDILINATLFRPFFRNIPTVDGISWYLEVLIVFYIVSVLYNKFLPFKNFENLVIFVLLALIFKVYSFLYYVLFILIGCCFAYHIKKLYTIKQLIISSILLMFALYFTGVKSDPNFIKIFPNYIWGLSIFTITYFCRETGIIKKIADFKPIRFISKISFPIFLVHGASGYVIMAQIYTKLCQSYFVCVFAVVIWTLLVSLILHKIVEKPTKACISKINKSSV